MNVQYVTDSKGKTTGVFIPISEWNELKEKYKDKITIKQGIEFGKDIEQLDIPEWQIKQVRKRNQEYISNPELAMDFDAAMENIEKDL